jgi:hypothetical protein
MISLKEILHTIGQEKKTGLIPIDDWKFTDAEHLAVMGFDFNNDYSMQTDREPRMKVYKKKELNPEGKESIFFFLEEDGKPTKKFSDFNDLVDFFDKYSQPDLDKNM